MNLLDVFRMLALGLMYLMIYCLVVGTVASVIMRRVKRNRPTVQLRAEQTALSAPEPVERRGKSWSQLPGWVAHDRAWAVAVVLLGAPDLADRTAPFVNFAARQIDWLGLRLAATGWPRHERLMVDVAHDLAIGTAPQLDDLYPADPVTVLDLLGDLDQPHVDLVYAAVDLHRGSCSLAQAQSVADGLELVRGGPDA